MEDHILPNSARHNLQQNLTYVHPNQHSLLLQKMLMRLYSDYCNKFVEHSLLNTKKRHASNLMRSGGCPVQSENIYVFLLDRNTEWGTSKSQMYANVTKHFR